MKRQPLQIIALFAFAASIAWAHAETMAADGFRNGFIHPFSGPDHLLAMLAVGLWGAQLGSPAVWLLPVTFPMIMAFGGTIGLMGISLPLVELGVAASAIALGACVLLEARPPLWAAAVLVGFFGIFHGNAHGTELPPGASGLMYSIGFVIATGSIHMAGVAIGLVHRWKSGRVALRLAGAAVGLAGCVFLWDAVS